MIQPIIGLGHSMGCVQLVHLAHWHPQLFHALVFVESPVQHPVFGQEIIVPWMLEAILKKEEFQSRAEAEEGIVKAYRAAKWDMRALQRLKSFGVYQANVEGNSVWRFTTTNAQNASLIGRFDPHRVELLQESEVEERQLWAFGRPEIEGAWDILPNIRPWVLYVNGSNSLFQKTKTRNERAGRTGTGKVGNGGLKLGAVRQVLMQGSEHNMIFDRHIGLLAVHVSQWLREQVQRWDKATYKVNEGWQAKSPKDKQTVPEGFVDALKKEAVELKKARKSKL